MIHHYSIYNLSNDGYHATGLIIEIIAYISEGFILFLLGFTNLDVEVIK